jgi:hypothetical protein
MTGRAEIVRWIQHLADADPQSRAAHFQQLHAEGLALCSESLTAWSSDPEFRELIRPVAKSSSPLALLAGAIVVGVAVTRENFERIRMANGNAPLSSVPPNQDAQEFEIHIEGSLNFDILTTTDPLGSGAIARYLQKFGEGIQQIEIYVRDVDRATKILRDRFHVTPIYPATQTGADATRVNFFLAPAPEGKKVLIELVEPSHE